jgi:predicted TIM-barrel fold metal-dependent hydrolase
LDRAGIDVGIVFAPLYEGGAFDDYTYERGNDAIAEACEKFPDRLVGYGRVNPNFLGKATKEFRRCIEQLGLRGLMLHPEWESFLPNNKRLMWPLAEICAEHRLPITFHTGYYPTCEPMLFVPLAEAFPQVPIYLKHTGYQHWRDATIVAHHMPNVYIETGCNSTTGEILHAIQGAGADKVCYGSDLPYVFPELVISKIRSLPISDEDKANVLGLNSAGINSIPVPAAAAE